MKEFLINILHASMVAIITKFTLKKLNDLIHSMRKKSLPNKAYSTSGTEKKRKRLTIKLKSIALTSEHTSEKNYTTPL